MAHTAAATDQGKQRGGSAPCKGLKRKATVVLPGCLAAHLQSRQLINSMRLRPADSASSQGARVAPLAATASTASSGAGSSAGCEGGAQAGAPRTYVPVRTLPLIFAQRKRHLQQQKSKQQHAAPYQRRSGEGLLALPEDVLLKVVCLLTHDELRPLFQVCKALRSTLRSAVAYHFNYSTPSRPTEDAAPPALGERQKRPARTNHLQVISRLSRGGRGGAAGRGGSGGTRTSAPRALNFADTPPGPQPAVASRA